MRFGQKGGSFMVTISIHGAGMLGMKGRERLKVLIDVERMRIVRQL